jgi:hypothetical protein
MLQYLKDAALSRFAGNHQRLVPNFALQHILTPIQTDTVLLLRRAVTFNAAVQQQRTDCFLERFFTVRLYGSGGPAESSTQQQQPNRRRQSAAASTNDAQTKEWTLEQGVEDGHGKTAVSLEAGKVSRQARAGSTPHSTPKGRRRTTQIDATPRLSAILSAAREKFRANSRGMAGITKDGNRENRRDLFHPPQVRIPSTTSP